MTISKITFIETIPVGQFANVKLGLEAIPGENESPLEVFEKLRATVQSSFQSMYPHAGEAHTYSTTPQPVEVSVHNQREVDDEIQRRFMETKERVVSAKTKEDAKEILEQSEFKLSADLKKLVLSKPNKINSNNALP